MKKLEINGRAFTYELDEPRPGRRGRRGEGEATDVPTIVLLHGFPLNARVWADVARLLAADFRVMRPNLRGFGTFVCDHDFDLSDLAADVHDVLHELRLTPCVMAGLSMGGYVALAYAQNWADDLRGLALVNSRASADDEAAKVKRDAMARLAETRGTAAVVAQMHPKMLAPAAYAADPGRAESLLRIMLDTPAPTIARAARAMRDRRDQTAMLATLDVPVAVIAGDEDQVVPADEAEALTELLPAAAFHRVEGAGHMSPLENPRAVAAALGDLTRRAFA